jgi:Protein of unknown function (DUF2934)
VDIEKHRKKQQKLMVTLVERKVRSRAQQLYETRGQAEGQALADWVQAESDVLGNSILAPLYRRVKAENQEVAEPENSSPAHTQNSSPRETTV